MAGTGAIPVPTVTVWMEEDFSRIGAETVGKPEEFSSGVFYPHLGGLAMENIRFVLVCILTVALLFVAASLFSNT